MASLTTEHCRHQFLTELPGSACIFCNFPRPAFDPPPLAIRSERGEGKQTIRVESFQKLNATMDRLREEAQRPNAVAYRAFLAGSDPGDEDR